MATTDLIERPPALPGTAAPAPEEERDFPDVRIKARFITKRDGRDFVLYPGLIDALHSLSEGYFELQTTVAQLPSAENGQCAVVTARVSIFDTQQRDVPLREATGIGDASPANVSRAMAPHLIRMAETRAKARALRDLLNVAVASLEDEGPAPDDRSAPPAAAPGQPAPPAGAPTERILVNGRPYSRAEVWDAYTRRRAQAREAGLALEPDETGKQPHDPLPVLVGATQSIRKKLEGRP
jgi:hypothetical protein